MSKSTAAAGCTSSAIAKNAEAAQVIRGMKPSPIPLNGTNGMLPEYDLFGRHRNQSLKELLAPELASQLLALHVAVQRVIERHRQVVAEALGNAGVELFQHHAGHRRHVELLSILDPHPDKLD